MLAGGAPLSEFLDLAPGERVLALAPLAAEGAGLALGTERGVVKRVAPDFPSNKDAFEVIRLDDGDRVVGAVQLPAEEVDLVFVTSDAQLLRFPASAVRPQGRPAGGMAGIKLAPGARVAFFGAVAPSADAVVVTVHPPRAEEPEPTAEAAAATPAEGAAAAPAEGAAAKPGDAKAAPADAKGAAAAPPAKKEGGKK